MFNIKRLRIGLSSAIGEGGVELGVAWQVSDVMSDDPPDRLSVADLTTLA